MVLLFFDIFLVKRAFPALFEEVRSSHPAVLYVSGVVGIGASAFGAYVTFRSPWTPLFTVRDWRLWLGILVGVSAYASEIAPAIARSKDDVDRAMRWGFGWALGPFETFVPAVTKKPAGRSHDSARGAPQETAGAIERRRKPGRSRRRRARASSSTRR